MKKSISNPILTIVTITLNDQKGLLRTVKSVKAQIAGPEFEHLIIDGLSNYDVGALLAEQSSKAKLLQGKDDGIYDAMNRGTHHATGDYIIYLNGGDEFASENVLREVCERLEKSRPDFLYGDSLEQNIDGKITHKPARSHSKIPYGMFTHHQSMIFKRKIINALDLEYDISLKIAADYDFIVRFLRGAKIIERYEGVIAKFEAGGVSQYQHKLGRREQFHVRSKQYESVLFSIRIYALQFTAQHFRIASPRLYWKIRSILQK